MGRKPQGGEALSPAERARRYRQRKAAARLPALLVPEVAPIIVSLIQGGEAVAIRFIASERPFELVLRLDEWHAIKAAIEALIGGPAP